MNLMAPSRKVSVGLLSGSIVALILLGLQVFDPSVADKIPPAGASELATVVGFLVAYLVPAADQSP